MEIKMDIVIGLEKLREFLHGAHLATNDENAGSLLHLACHKIDELILEIARNEKKHIKSVE